MKLTHKFVTFIPEQLEDRVLYISIEYSTAIHKCCCGCGNQVVTPFSPTGWKLIFDGESVSLSPSIGNWKLQCQSHYWITNDMVEWAPKWTKEQIEREAERDKESQHDYYSKKNRRSLFDIVFRRK